VLLDLPNTVLGLIDTTIFTALVGHIYDGITTTYVNIYLLIVLLSGPSIIIILDGIIGSVVNPVGIYFYAIQFKYRVSIVNYT
jgi:hypothetical protein